MSDAPAASEFAAARASLRDTIKWLVGVASGLGAVLAAGISFTALGALEGAELGLAIVLGAIALSAMMLSLGALLEVLLVRPFTLDELRGSPYLLHRLNGSGILPPGYTTLDELIANRDAALHDLQIDEEDAAAQKNLADSAHEIGRAQDLAAFLDLRDKVKATIRHLALWVAVIAVATAGIGILVGRAGADKPAATADPVSKSEQLVCDGVALNVIVTEAEADAPQLGLSLPADCLRLTVKPSENSSVTN